MIRRLALTAAALGTALALAIPQPASAAPRYTWWQLITAPSWCVTDPGGDAWWGVPLKLDRCGQGARQWWTAVPSRYGHGQYYSIMLYDHRNGGFCADDDTSRIGGAVQLWGCNGSAAQAWFPIRLANGGLAWQNPNGGIITNYKGRLLRGNPVLVWRWVGNPAQFMCGPVYC